MKYSEKFIADVMRCIKIILTFIGVAGASSAFGQPACSYSGNSTHGVGPNYSYYFGNYLRKETKRGSVFCDGVGGYLLFFSSYLPKDYPDAYASVNITLYDDNATENSFNGLAQYSWPGPSEVATAKIPDWVRKLIDLNHDLFRRHIPNYQQVLSPPMAIGTDAPKTTGRGARGG
jgi:hypothetical protein